MKSKYKYYKTIKNGAEKYIDGIENIEMFLGEDDDWNFHDSEIRDVVWDVMNHEMTVTVEPIGYFPNIEGEARDLAPLLDFHFENVINVKMDYNGERIYSIAFSIYNKWLECWFNGCCIRVTGERVRVDKPRFVPIDSLSSYFTISLS